MSGSFPSDSISSSSVGEGPLTFSVYVPVCKKPGLVFRSFNLFFFFLHGRVCEERDLKHDGRYAFRVREASTTQGAIWVDTAQVREGLEGLRYMYDKEAGRFFSKETKPHFGRRNSDIFSRASTTWGVSGDQTLEPGFESLYFADSASTLVVPNRAEEVSLCALAHA